MTREELIALRDAIDMTLALPDSIRELFAQWLAPEAVKPNGRDPHPETLPADRRAPRRRTRRANLPVSAKVAEQRLLEAMRDNPDLTVIALANAVSLGRSTAGERLRQLAARGLVEKSAMGRWRLTEEEPRSAGPTSAPLFP
jgi:Winged helix-turn-helix DNA-binding